MNSLKHAGRNNDKPAASEVCRQGRRVQGLLHTASHYLLSLDLLKTTAAATVPARHTSDVRLLLHILRSVSRVHYSLFQTW